MEHHTAGDPITGLKWTRKTTLKISHELGKVDLDVSPRTVARLLKALKFSLRVNHKKLAGNSNPYRNQQFEYISRMRKRFEQRGLPIISIDTKKKEMIGRFKNAGSSWGREAIPVNDHDFKKDASGVAVPWGLFEPTVNRGHVFVGTSHDTPAFAVTALIRWWRRSGQRRYPQANRLLILADGGGSNGPRNRAWLQQMQIRFCNPLGIKVTLCHYPPGTSKWNPIEHRLFSAISRNWAGQPLESYETVLKFIRTTKTQTGLTVTASLLEGNYPVGVKPSKAQMAEIRLRRHQVLPLWNYTFIPAAAS